MFVSLFVPIFFFFVCVPTEFVSAEVCVGHTHIQTTSYFATADGGRFVNACIKQ